MATKLKVEELKSRFSVTPDEDITVLFEVQQRPDYVDTSVVKVHLSFLVRGRVFKNECEELKAVVHSSLAKHFEEAVPAFVADVERFTNG